MKIKYFYIFSLFSYNIFFGCAEKKIYMEDLSQIYTARFSAEGLSIPIYETYYHGKLFTGVAYEMWNDEQVKSEIFFKEGYQHGPTTKYYSNGQLHKSSNYKNGERDGHFVHYSEYGKKLRGGVYIDGSFFSDTFYLHSNGLTIMCPNSEPGDIGKIEGIEYESVDRTLLNIKISDGEDLSKICVSTITNMRALFKWERDFNNKIKNWVGIGNWDVSKVTDMSEMFYESHFNHPIENWDVSNVENMEYMFYSSPFNQPIGDWNVSNVADMYGMFMRTPFNQPIGNWDVSNVTDMGAMFLETPFNQPIGHWNVSSVTNMRSMFARSKFNKPIGNWDVGNVTEMQAMFGGGGNYFNPIINPFDQPINNWCVKNFSNEPHMIFDSRGPMKTRNKPAWGTCPD